MNPESSPLFTPWTNPESGVTIYLLTKKVAPVQEAFYFVNNSLSGDGRYLWFYCAFPPSGSGAQGRTLAVVDFETQQIHHYPETQFNHATPYVDPDTGAIYWGMGEYLFRRGPQPGDSVETVNRIPADLIGARTVHRFATHLTLSADKRSFFIDAEIGLESVFGELPVDGSDYTLWYRFNRNHNHAQFSPTDPHAILYAQENHPDPITGLTFPITNRLWYMERGGQPCQVLREPRKVTHEWWDSDGVHAWCVYGNDVLRINVFTHEEEHIAWNRHSWHAHSSRDGQMIVGDSNEKFYRGCPSRVDFLNRATNRQVELVKNPEMKGYTGAKYHIDPHPRFIGADRWVVFTTTMRGEVDLAVAPVDGLLEKTS